LLFLPVFSPFIVISLEIKFILNLSNSKLSQYFILLQIYYYFNVVLYFNTIKHYSCFLFLCLFKLIHMYSNLPLQHLRFPI
jgi:hypothetical protein